MKDRILELQEIACEAADGDEYDAFLEHQKIFEEPMTKEMVQLFEEVEITRTLIDHISEMVRSLKQMHAEILSCPLYSPEKKSLIDELMSCSDKEIKTVRINLEESAKEIQRQETAERSRLKKTPKATFSTELRIRSEHYHMMTKKFGDIATEYNTAQNKFRENCRLRIERQRRFLGCENLNSQDAVDEALMTGNFASITQQICTDTEIERQRLLDTEARHDDMIKLEGNISELHDIFVDMAFLVDSQGNVADRIEGYLEEAGEGVHHATEYVREAKRLQQLAKKRKLVLVIIGAVILLILICTIFGIS